MLDIELSSSLLAYVVPLLIFYFVISKSKSSLFPVSCLSNSGSEVPKSYPVIGSLFELRANWNQRVQWISDAVKKSPTSTLVLHLPFGQRAVFTGNVSNVKHILKTRFDNYNKGEFVRKTMSDLLGHGIFNADGENWKFQRQVAGHEFKTNSLRKFIEQVVDVELADRLIPILSAAAEKGTVLDLQDILKRFAFDNICEIAFGYDPAYLLPSLPASKFQQAFQIAVGACTDRFEVVPSVLWKIMRILDIGSEKQIRIAVKEIRKFAKQVVDRKKQDPESKSDDLLSRFLSSGHSDEDFVIDIIISFILAGQDTTSAAMTFFFWVISQDPDAESAILQEINTESEVKEFLYTHASLCETMRLYPPVPMDLKEAANDDVLPDGTIVKKGMIVAYHPYAMGRMEDLWGVDWADFRPERWLQRETAEGKWSFVAKDAYAYPVFQAGPRVCLGKEMSFLQMKRVVSSVLRQFRVVPVMEEHTEPELICNLILKMKNGLPVRIEKRDENF